MSLTSCFRCKAQVSDAAASCPHCGLPQPAEHTLHREKLAEAERLWAAIPAGPGAPPALICPECGAEGFLRNAPTERDTRLNPACSNCGAPNLLPWRGGHPDASEDGERWLSHDDREWHVVRYSYDCAKPCVNCNTLVFPEVRVEAGLLKFRHRDNRLCENLRKLRMESKKKKAEDEKQVFLAKLTDRRSQKRCVICNQRLGWWRREFQGKETCRAHDGREPRGPGDIHG